MVHSGNAGNSKITTAWLCAAIGMALLLSCGCFPFVSIVPTGLAAIGMIQAKAARDLGHPQGQTAFIFSLVVLILGLLAFIMSILTLFAWFPDFILT